MVEAAIRCLSRGHGANLTVSAIMAEAKVSRGLVNHYFPTMTNLLVEAFKAMIGGLEARTLADMRRKSGSAGLQLRVMVDVSFGPLNFEHKQNQTWLELWSLMPTEPELKKVNTELYRQYRRQLTEVIGRLAAERKLDINAKRLATATIALVDGFWLNWSINSRFVSAAEGRRACIDMLEAQLGPI